jgi:abortive infection bacteriophage resistance protein
MSKQAKLWISFSDQLELLQSRGLLIENTAAALDYLERIGYYRLAGYWYPLRKLKAQPQGHSFRENEFIADSRFEDGVRLYVFDKKLRLLALDALERIELAVRVDISYVLGQHDTFAHKNKSLFHPNFLKPNPKNPNSQSNYDKWLEGFNKLQSKAKKTVFVEHNIAEYGDLPIWVAIEIMDFGCLSHLFAGLRTTSAWRGGRHQ